MTRKLSCTITSMRRTGVAVPSSAAASPSRLKCAIAISVGLAALPMSRPACAIEIPTGVDGLTLKWDNTVKYSAAVRLKKASNALVSPGVNSNNSNLDDGDRNFGKGLISNRIDILSELDAAYRGFGLRVTGAGWYDTVYNKHNDNPGFGGGAFPNQTSVPADEFVHKTRKIHGRDAELLDAFVYGGFDLGTDQRLAFRAGRHALVWGETFFFGANGIAGGMMPVDVVKLQSVPNTQFKEAIRPVPMLSGQLQITPETSVGAYYQFKWEGDRIPAVGSYFSPADTTPDGAEQLLLAGPGSPFLQNAPRLADLKPKNSGQGGVQLRSRFGETDVGLYAIRYAAKIPQQVINVGLAPVVFDPSQGCVVHGSVSTGETTCALIGPVSYRLLYPEAITSQAISASRTFGSVNLATEWSVRKNQPLNTALASDTSALTHSSPNDNARNPGYPVARTAHINVSSIWSIDPNPLFKEGSLSGEIGWNRVLSVTRRRDLVDPSATRSAVAFRGLFQTVHRQVLTGFDVAPSLGVGWAPKGSRSAITTTDLPQNGNADVTLGTEVTYLDTWRTSLSYTHYTGSPGGFLIPAGNGASKISFKQYYADRDFISFSLRHSF